MLTVNMPGTHRGQKKALGSLVIMVVCHHVNAGDQARVLCRSNSTLMSSSSLSR